MQIVPTQPLPNQSFQVQLNNQACIINLYQTPRALFMDLYVGTELIKAGQICENLNRIVRDTYLGFVGDLAFVDAQSATNADASDPIYTGLGTRFQLLYLDPSELPADGE